MSALTDRIAAEHQPESGEWSVCICGQADLRYGRAWDRHLVEVTDAAVRKRVAQDIEEARSQAPAWVAESHLSTWQAALAYAARIANGEA